MNGPLFPIGFTVNVNRYFGLCRVDGENAGDPRDISARRARDVRLQAEVGEDWDSELEDTVATETYPRGWEYFFVGMTGREWGWISEDELVRAGYAPPVATPQLQGAAS